MTTNLVTRMSTTAEPRQCSQTKIRKSIIDNKNGSVRLESSLPRFLFWLLPFCGVNMTTPEYIHHLIHSLADYSTMSAPSQIGYDYCVDLTGLTGVEA